MQKFIIENKIDIKLLTTNNFRRYNRSLRAIFGREIDFYHNKTTINVKI